MRLLIKQYGGVILSCMVAICIAMIMYIMYPKVSIVVSEIISSDNIEIKSESHFIDSEHLKPIIVVKDAILDKDEVFDYTQYVRAYNHQGKDISHLITIVGDSVDSSQEGIYKIKYKCTYQGISTYAIGTYIIE